MKLALRAGPATEACAQWLPLGRYITVAINNLRILRKLKKA